MKIIKDSTAIEFNLKPTLVFLDTNMYVMW